MKKILILAASLFCTLLSFGEIRLPKIYSDNMVLQRAKPLEFWGVATPDSDIKIEFAGLEKSGKADKNGVWRVKFAPLNASETPLEMRFYENGKLSKTVKNILIGEVWLLGGQSNMSWPLRPTSEWKNVSKRIKDFSNIRCFKNSKIPLPENLGHLKFGSFETSSLQSSGIAQTPQKDYPDGYSWEMATTKNMELWSSIGVHFADNLSKSLGVPVGIIMTSLGGTPMASWIPQKNMDKVQFLKERWKDFERKMVAWKNEGYEKALADYNARMSTPEIAKGIKPKTGGWRYFVPPSKLTFFSITDTPCLHFNAKIAPLEGVGIAGVLWYQGEADAWRRSTENFEAQMLVVIDSWRELFGKVPFIQAQLSSYGRGKIWPQVRDAQLKVALDNWGVYAVCTIDGGDEKNIHPDAKKLVADRMYRTALGEIYGGEKIGQFSPNMKKVEYKGSTAKVLFDLYESTLVMRGELRGIEVLCNGKWSPAVAELEKDVLLLKSSDGSDIEGVSYLWKPYPQEDVCIYNTEGLPLFPFRNLK